jgi:protocatechuate 3,4-dioxygenase alpha subunit
MTAENPNRLAPTPGQTVGPFFGYALPYAGGGDLVPPGRPGAIQLHGFVRDGAGAPIPDALLEIWQADPDGQVPRQAGSLRRDGYPFTGWGRAATDNAGHYSFTTLEPGATDDGRAPFFAVTVFARGLLDRLFTRVYLPDHPALSTDPLLGSLPADRRATLVARREPSGRSGDGSGGLAFDVTLQGDGETVFLSYPGH